MCGRDTARVARAASDVARARRGRDGRERDAGTSNGFDDDDDDDDDALRERARRVGLGAALETRAARWARALGIAREGVDEAAFAAFAAARARDERTVAADVSRSAQQYALLAEEELEEVRNEIREILGGALNAHAGGVHYYQGLHDVATAVALVDRKRPRGTPAMGAAILERLVLFHLRDHTRKDLSSTMEMTAMFLELLTKVAPELGDALGRAPPFYAVSWFMCLFLHDVRVLDVAVRLLDLFIASHPLMPIYVGAALVMANKAEILKKSSDALDLHSTMARLRVADATATVDEQFAQTQRLIEIALQIYADHPPDRRTFTLAFARNSASARFPYPWLAADVRVARAPLDDAVVPRDIVHAWPLHVIDAARAIARTRRLRARGSLTAKRQSPIRSAVFSLFFAVAVAVAVAFAFVDDPTVFRAFRAPPSPPPNALFPFAFPTLFSSAARSGVRRRRLAFLP
jgi:TBC1 domain family member 20